MKKIIGIVMFIGSLFLINNNTVNAEVESEILAEIVESKIEVFEDQSGYEDTIEILKDTDLSEYTNSDDKVNVYLFHSTTCGYCAQLVGYLTSLVPEYGDIFNVVGYETMYSQDNNTLMQEIATEMGESANGVPFMVIGDQAFIGYSSSMDSEILSKIQAEYSADEKYDILEILDNPEVEDEENSSNQLVVIMILLNMILTVGCTGYIVYKMNNKIPVKK